MEFFHSLIFLYRGVYFEKNHIGTKFNTRTLGILEQIRCSNGKLLEINLRHRRHCDVPNSLIVKRNTDFLLVASVTRCMKSTEFCFIEGNVQWWPMGKYILKHK